MIDIYRCSRSSAIDVSRTRNRLIQTRISGRYGFTVLPYEEWLSGRGLPIKVCWKISSVLPREHIHIIKGRTAVIALVKEDIMSGCRIAMSGRNQRLSTPTVIISLSECQSAGLMGLFLRLDKGIASVCTDFLEEFLTGISGSLPSLRIKIAAKGVLVSLRMPFYITVEGRAGCPLKYLELQCHGTCPCHSSVIDIILFPAQVRDRLIQQSYDIVHGLQEGYAREVHRFINVNRMVQPWDTTDIAEHIKI